MINKKIEKCSCCNKPLRKNSVVLSGKKYYCKDCYKQVKKLRILFICLAVLICLVLEGLLILLSINMNLPYILLPSPYVVILVIVLYSRHFSEKRVCNKYNKSENAEIIYERVASHLDKYVEEVNAEENFIILSYILTFCEKESIYLNKPSANIAELLIFTNYYFAFSVREQMSEEEFKCLIADIARLSATVLSKEIRFDRFSLEYILNTFSNRYEFYLQCIDNEKMLFEQAANIIIYQQKIDGLTQNAFDHQFECIDIEGKNKCINELAEYIKKSEETLSDAFRSVIESYT